VSLLWWWRAIVCRIDGHDWLAMGTVDFNGRRLQECQRCGASRWLDPLRLGRST
jgi:hypothetical protein